ncbi:MAG TPA: PAS domain-containing protein [Nitrospiraceae bacterium]|nr:PAS domain-containing protein [Nitrospiraceae bacterium]
MSEHTSQPARRSNDGTKEPVRIVKLNGEWPEEKQTVRLTLLVEAAELLLAEESSASGMDAVFRLIAPHFGLDSYWDYDNTEAEDELRLAGSSGLLDEMVPAFQSLKYGEALCGICAKQRAPLVRNRIQDSTDAPAALAKRNGTQAYACYPLMAGEFLLGTLGFGSRGRTSFDADELEFLGTIARYVAMVKARQRSEARLRKRHERCELLAKMAAALLKSEESTAVVEPLCEMMREHVSMDAYLAYALDERGGEAVLEASAGLPDEVVAPMKRLTAAQALCGVSDRVPQPAPAHPDQDVEEDLKAEAMRRVGSKAYVCHPLSVGTRCLGVLSVGSKSKDRFDADENDFIRTVCHYAAMAKERLRLLSEVRRREDMLMRAQRAAKAGLWEIDLRTNRLTWSDAYYELFSLDRGSEPSMDGWLSRIHSDDRERVKAQYEQAIAAQRDQECEYRILLPNGSVQWVHRKGQIERDAEGRPVRLSGLTFDVTERKQGEEALRASEERWQLAVNGSTDGMWDWDLRAKKVFLSSRWKATRGYAEHEIGDDEAERTSRIHPDDAERVMRTVQLYLDKRIPLYECEYRSRCKDGSYRWISDRGQAVWDEHGQVVRMVGSEVDISGRKRAEEALRQLNQELEQRVKERTEALVRSQARLRALATELNLSEQRQRQHLSADLHDYLAQLLVFVRLKLNQAKRAGLASSAADLIGEADATLTQALTYTRSLIAELSPPVLRDFGLVAALQWLADQMRRHELIVTLERHVEEVALPEEKAVLLFQSVRELLLNVSKHAGTDRAAVIVTETDEMLCIEVKDQGRGFDVQEVQMADSGSRESSRYGLFSIRERMSALGGDFDLDSMPGRGTTATLMLPLTPEAPQAAPASSDLEILKEEYTKAGVEPGTAFVQPEGPRPTREWSGFARPHSPISVQPSLLKTKAVTRVLLADDHAMLRQGLRSVLDAYADVEVVGEASDGEEAIRLAQSLQPDIVVMDVNMPGVDGIEATRQLRHEQPTIAVIGLSVHNNPRVEQAMREAGVTGFLTKESAVEQLYLAIQDALGYTR